MYHVENYVECPVCRQKTFKRYDELPKNRLIIQYLEMHPINQISSSSLQPTVATSAKPALNFERAISTNGGWDNKKYLKKVFGNIDQNQDGHISISELFEALKDEKGNFSFFNNNESNTLNKLQAEIETLFAKHDANKDNKLSFDQFVDLYVEINEKYAEIEISSRDQDTKNQKVKKFTDSDNYW